MRFPPGKSLPSKKEQRYIILQRGRPQPFEETMTTTAPPPNVLVPAAPPKVLDGVYTDEQYERMLALIKREGPWGTIISHHFETVDELMATISGVVPPDHGLTLDDVAGPH